jgi:hypothetical protein
MGGGHEMVLVGVFHTAALERPEGIPISQSLEVFLPEYPEAVAAPRAELAPRVRPEIILDAVALQQRVVHAHKKRRWHCVAPY